MVRAGADHQEGCVDDAAKHPAVGQAEHGRSVEDDTVVVVLKRDQELP